MHNGETKMNDINLSNWSARAASPSLEQWQGILQWQMSLRGKIWDLKIAAEDIKTKDLLRDAVSVLESAHRSRSLAARSLLSNSITTGVSSNL